MLERPPAGVDFGLQQGRGSEYETIQKQRSRSEDLRFDFTVRARAARQGAAPVLLGELVQGPPAERFVYVDVGTYAGQKESMWSRRMKVLVSGIPGDLINKVAQNPGLTLEARIPATGKDGGPNCGTVKTIAGWTVVRSRSK